MRGGTGRGRRPRRAAAARQPPQDSQFVQEQDGASAKGKAACEARTEELRQQPRALEKELEDSNRHDRTSHAAQVPAAWGPQRPLFRILAQCFGAQTV